MVGRFRTLIQRLRSDPKNPRQWYKLARAYQRAGDREQALAALSKAVIHRPGEPDLCASIARAYEALGEAEAAVHTLELACSLAPASAEPQLHLGELYLRQGRPNEATPCLERAVTLAPQDCHAHASLGAALVQLGQVPDAVRVLEHAVSLPSRDSYAFLLLATALKTLGSFEQAMAAVEAAAKLAPDDPDVTSCKGMILIAMGHPDRGAELLAEKGAIPPTALTRLHSQAQENPDHHIAADLLRQGTVAEPPIRSALEQQVKTVLQDALSWNGGLFVFEAKANGKTDCQICKGPGECPKDAPACNFGYCERQ